MLKTDEEFAQRVEEAVRAIEQRTSAEIVVVAAPRSDRYRDTSLAVGALAGWLVLWPILFSPVTVAPLLVPAEVLLVGALVGGLVHRSPRLLRRLVPAARLQERVQAAARAAFVEEAVSGTRGRTGLLIYLSALEDRVLLLPDAGLASRIPGGEWNALRWGSRPDPGAPGDLEHFLAGLSAVGDILARHLPRDADDANELPDAPRIRT